MTFTDTRKNTISMTPKLRHFIIVSTQDKQFFTAVPLFTYDRNGLQFFSESKKASYISFTTRATRLPETWSPPLRKLRGIAGCM